MAESFPNRSKTLWEKDKLLATSNFSFSHSAFKRSELQTRKSLGLFGKGLSVFIFPVLQQKEIVGIWGHSMKRGVFPYPAIFLNQCRNENLVSLGCIGISEGLTEI